jgi:hypothetical protein
MSLIDDGNQEQPTGGQEQPTSAPSGGQQGQQLSNVDALVKTVEELRKEIRGIQKGTDKRFERQDDNIKRILELKEQGLSEPQIKRELYIDSLMQGQDTPPQAPGGTESARQAPDVESAFRTVEEYELSTNEPDFIALLRTSSKLDKAAFDAKVKDYILGKKKPPKPANPADVVQAPATAAASVNGDTGAKIARLNELQKQPTKNREEIKKLAEELDRAGWK